MASTRPKFVEDRSDAFEEWHRNQLPADARVMDCDLVYATEDGTVYLLGEVITIRCGTLEDADTERYELWDYKARVLEDLSARLGVPSFIVWKSPQNDEEVAVKVLPDEDVRRMNADEYNEMLRLARRRHRGRGASK